VVSLPWKVNNTVMLAAHLVVRRMQAVFVYP